MTKSQTTAHEPTRKNESDFGAHSNSPESTKTFNIDLIPLNWIYPEFTKYPGTA